jgi:anthranilate phosphoribosyltransferase
MVPKMANALARLGTRKSWIVHGLDGLDEISLTDATLVAEVENGGVKTFEVQPENFGFDRQNLDDLRVGSADESANLIRDVLEGKRKGDACEALVIVNAMAAFYLANHCENIEHARGPIAEAIHNGDALSKLNQLAERCPA